ncbi:MAG TPA: hypothetical protein VK966_13810 [Longimicrobiales bacterium]|nr:hypothetical protein [Longimicrobiales bacterium]
MIGTVTVLGHQLWAGWLMIAALGYSTVAPFALGRLKLPLARALHDKTLRADAVAAGLIALDVARDGTWTGESTTSWPPPWIGWIRTSRATEGDDETPAGRTGGRFSLSA